MYIYITFYKAHEGEIDGTTTRKTESDDTDVHFEHCNASDGKDSHSEA